MYEITESSADYIGCYLDGQQLTTCAEAPTCEMCALMGAPTALNPEGCGWSGRNGGGCFPGYSTSPWECAVVNSCSPIYLPPPPLPPVGLHTAVNRGAEGPTACARPEGARPSLLPRSRRTGFVP